MTAPACDGAVDCPGRVVVGVRGRLLCLRHWREVEPPSDRAE
jgi:hypothetical protein